MPLTLLQEAILLTKEELVEEHSDEFAESLHDFNELRGRNDLIEKLIVRNQSNPDLSSKIQEIINNLKNPSHDIMEVTLISLFDCGLAQLAKAAWVNLKLEGPPGVKVIKRELTVYKEDGIGWFDMFDQNIMQSPSIIKSFKNRELFTPAKTKLFPASVLERTPEGMKLNPLIFTWLKEEW